MSFFRLTSKVSLPSGVVLIFLVIFEYLLRIRQRVEKILLFLEKSFQLPREMELVQLGIFSSLPS